MRCYPGFELATHKGYGTPAHLSALRGARALARSTGAPSAPCGSPRSDEEFLTEQADELDARRCHWVSSTCGCTPSTRSSTAWCACPSSSRRSAAAGMPAVAVTDQNNLFAMVKFYREALRAASSRSSAWICWCARRASGSAPSRLTLLCQTQDGYRNLARLVSRAYLEGQERGVPRIERAWLTPENVAGLIALSGASEGDVGRALVNARERGCRAGARWRGSALFPGRFYLELQRLGRPFEEAYIAARRGAGRAPRGAGGRHQRRALPQGRRVRLARGARLHPRRRAARRSRRACAATRASSTCAARRRWRRCSPTSPRRSPTRWRSRAAAA